MTPTEIKALRKSLGLTQSRFGRLLGLDGKDVSNTVRSWESGRRVPSGPVTKLMLLLERDPRLLGTLFV